MPLSEALIRIYQLTVTVPANTPITAPISVPWVTENAVINSIELMIPPGNNAVAGIRIMKGDVQLLPWGATSWIVGNDYNNTFPIGGYLPTTDISVQAYNTGGVAHSFYLRMSLQSTANAAVNVTSGPVDIVDSGAATDTSDPLSPAAIIGPDAVDALTNGLDIPEAPPLDMPSSDLPGAPTPPV